MGQLQYTGRIVNQEVGPVLGSSPSNRGHYFKRSHPHFEGAAGRPRGEGGREGGRGGGGGVRGMYFTS